MNSTSHIQLSITLIMKVHTRIAQCLMFVSTNDASGDKRYASLSDPMLAGYFG